MVLTMMCEKKGGEKEIDDVKSVEIYETKCNEEVYEKKGDEKEINDVKGQALGERSTRNPILKCWMSRWLRRHCGLESDESQRSRP